MRIAAARHLCVRATANEDGTERLTRRYASGVANEPSERGLKLVDVKDEGVRAALSKIDQMSDSELRDLARGEPDIFVEAVEGIIARRHPAHHS